MRGRPQRTSDEKPSNATTSRDDGSSFSTVFFFVLLALSHGCAEEGLAAKSRVIWKTWGDRKKNKVPKKLIPEKSLLNQIDEPEDLEVRAVVK